MFRCEACGALNRVARDHPEGSATCGRCQKPLPLTGAPQSVNGEQLDRVLASAQVPVVIDFWAPWCGPCRVSGPAYEAIGRERAGQALFLKVNTEEHGEVATRHGIRGIPTFIVFRNGREVARRSGAPPRAALQEWIDGALASPSSQPAP